MKEKLIKIGAKVVSHGRYVAFQMAEVAIPRNLFTDVLRLVAELRDDPIGRLSAVTALTNPALAGDRGLPHARYTRHGTPPDSKNRIESSRLIARSRQPSSWLRCRC
jgi:hypothetical protein